MGFYTLDFEVHTSEINLRYNAMPWSLTYIESLLNQKKKKKRIEKEIEKTGFDPLDFFISTDYVRRGKEMNIGLKKMCLVDSFPFSLKQFHFFFFLKEILYWSSSK
ncbi:hypothetical protein HMI55_000069 [Coelomomyces lativittatus]|nr:hypothetical protein HMI56_005723 [Coelomomyces lativittatus]KAJ1509194.1 hypothetical protein HMI55_000069 [Coelomomyces lativittatus]